MSQVYLLKYVEHRREEEPKKFSADQKVSIGDVICPSDADHYAVCGINSLKTGLQLLLGPPEPDPQEAYLRAVEEGHLVPS